MKTDEMLNQIADALNWGGSGETRPYPVYDEAMKHLNDFLEGWTPGLIRDFLLAAFRVVARDLDTNCGSCCRQLDSSSAFAVLCDFVELHSNLDAGEIHIHRCTVCGKYTEWHVCPDRIYHCDACGGKTFRKIFL